LLFCAGISGFAQNRPAPPGGAVSGRVLNNDYYVQSLRYKGLAQHSYDEGDYDASTAYAEEALNSARLSDQYVADHALNAAAARISWATSSTINAASRFPAALRSAQGAYSEAQAHRSAEEFRETVTSANQVFEALAAVSRPAGSRPASVLPARYTVRNWNSLRDCLWNIAAKPWVYGDPRQWRRLYNANKDRFPEPNNPNLIEPGMILEIPSIRGETRQGAWSPDATYPPLR
jgi:nucleoid-associated protein YgaU